MCVSVSQGMWAEEKQRCGFNYPAAAALRVGTRCQDVPGGTALTPPRPARRGHSLSQNASVPVTVGNGGATGTSEKTILFRPHCCYGNAPIFVPRETIVKAWGWDCLVDVLLCDVLQNDTSRLIFNTRMYHIPENLIQEATEALFLLFEQALHVFVCTLILNDNLKIII